MSIGQSMKGLLERIVIAGYVIILTFFLAAISFSFVTGLMNGEFCRSIHSLYHGGPRHMDFVRAYAMGKLACSSDRFQIYDPSVQLAWMNRVIAPAVMKSVFYMEHPPYVFFVIMPLAWFSITAAYVFWAVFSTVIAAIGVWLLVKKAFNKQTSFVLWLLFGLNASFVAWWSHLIGQFGMLLLFISCLFWWAILKKRDGVAGVALALSTIKPQHLLFLLLPVVADKRWKVLTVFALAELILFGLSALWFGWRNVVFYPFVLFRSELRPWSEFDFLPATVCLRGALAVYLPKAMAAGISTLVCLLILVVLFVLWRQVFTQKGNVSWPIALTMAASCAVGPHTFLYDCSVLVIAAGLTVSTLNPVSALRLKPLSLRIWTFSLLLYPLLSWVVSLWMIAPGDELSRYHRTILMVVLNLVIFIAGLVFYWRNAHCRALLNEQ